MKSRRNQVKYNVIAIAYFRYIRYVLFDLASSHDAVGKYFPWFSATLRMPNSIDDMPLASKEDIAAPKAHSVGVDLVI